MLNKYIELEEKYEKNSRYPFLLPRSCVNVSSTKTVKQKRQPKDCLGARSISDRKERRLSPEPVLEDSGSCHLRLCCLRSVTSGHRIRSVVSGPSLF